MADLYGNFAALQLKENEGVDYLICVTERASSVAIIAPHGGKIEPHTSKIAAAIAGDVHSLYCFEGLRKRSRELHITSTNFYERKCLDLIERCEIVVAVHGLKRKDCTVDVGGLDDDLRNAVCASLKAAGFRSKVVTKGPHAGISPDNVCNRGKIKKGVQLEIHKDLRDDFISGKKDLKAFAESVRQAIQP